jgi:hypothetical protein
MAGPSSSTIHCGASSTRRAAAACTVASSPAWQRAKRPQLFSRLLRWPRLIFGASRKLRASPPKRMPTLRIQMHLHGNSSFVQPNIVTQRVLDTTADRLTAYTASFSRRVLGKTHVLDVACRFAPCLGRWIQLTFIGQFRATEFASTFRKSRKASRPADSRLFFRSNHFAKCIR